MKGRPTVTREKIIQAAWVRYLRTQEHGKPISYDFDKHGPLRLPAWLATSTDAWRYTDKSEPAARVNVIVSKEQGYLYGKPATRYLGMIANEPGEPVVLEINMARRPAVTS